MDGSPPLLTNIQFAEAKKGYDRDQVDNFLRELSVKIGELQDMLRTATQRAEAAEARANEATRAQSASDGEIAELKAQLERTRADLDEARTAAPAAGADPVESATGVLAMAQKTADAAIAEAEGKAADTIADAKSRAAMISLEAEQEAARVKREAIDEADRLRASRVSRMEAEVEKLSKQRDGLQTDIEALSSHLDEHRTKLREHVDFFGRLLDEPGPLRMAPAPDLVGESFDGSNRRVGPAAEARGQQVGGLLEAPAATDSGETETVAGGADDEEPAPAAPDALATTDTDTDQLAAAVTGDEAFAPSADESSTDASGAEADALPTRPVGEDVDPAPPAEGDDAADRPFQPEGNGAEAVQSSLIDLTAQRLFEDTGEPTQAFDALAEPPAEDAPIQSTGSAPPPGSPLGEPDAEADEAMRAFFERDFADDDERNQGGGRFLRRK